MDQTRKSRKAKKRALKKQRKAFFHELDLETQREKINNAHNDALHWLKVVRLIVVSLPDQVPVSNLTAKYVVHQISCLTHIYKDLYTTLHDPSLFAAHSETENFKEAYDAVKDFGEAIFALVRCTEVSLGYKISKIVPESMVSHDFMTEKVVEPLPRVLYINNPPIFIRPGYLSQRHFPNQFVSS